MLCKLYGMVLYGMVYSGRKHLASLSHIIEIMWGQGNGYVLMMMMSKHNIQVYPFRKVGFVTKKVGFVNKCTSQGTESLYGWLHIIKLNRLFFRRVKGMNLRVRSTEQKTVVCWERPLAFGLGLLWKLEMVQPVKQKKEKIIKSWVLI